MRLQVEPGVDSKSNIKSTIRDREEVEVEEELNYPPLPPSERSRRARPEQTAHRANVGGGGRG